MRPRVCSSSSAARATVWSGPPEKRPLRGEAVSYTGTMSARPSRLSAGVVVVRETPAGWRFLLLRAFSHWDFPKAMGERGEGARSAPVREVREESLIDDLRFDWGHASTLTGPYSRGKVAEYFVARTETEAVTLPMNDELGRPEHSEYRWGDYEEALRIVSPR